MKLHNLTYMLFFIALFSCKANNYYSPDEIKYVSTVGEYDNLVGDTISIDALGSIDNISTIDSLLVIINNNPNGFISILNTNSDSLICNIGSKGNGPNEYIYPYSSKQYITNDNGDKLLCISDDRVRIGKLNITQSVKEKIAVCEKPIKIDLMFQNYFFLQEQDYFIKKNASYHDARDNIFYPPKYLLSCDNKESEYNVYPEVVVSTKYPHLPMFIYGGWVRMKPDLSKVVDAANLLHNMNILDLKTGKSIGFVENNTPFLNEIVNFSLEDLGKTKYYAGDVDVTNEYIIILYDGRTTYSVHKDGDKILRPTLKIFNWNGDFIRGYQLSDPLRGIAYNENNQCLYGYDLNSNLYKYQLTIK